MRLSIASLFCLIPLSSFGFDKPKEWTFGFHEEKTEPTSVVGITLDDREFVREFYRLIYSASSEIPMGWTGDYATENRGTTSGEWKDATLLRINFFRSMAGVPADIVFDSSLSLKCQDAAYIMSVNDGLSHFPAEVPGWTSLTPGGIEAARYSNIAIGQSGPLAVEGYIKDPGSGNHIVGHRRWKLYPAATVMGTGDVPGRGDPGEPDFLRDANATWVIDTDFGPYPQTRNEFVAWPPPGYVPSPLVYARWSFSLKDASFSNAIITMTKNGNPINLTVEPVSTANIGDPTIVWVPDGTNPYSPPYVDWPTPDADEEIEVSVNNVLVNGESKNFSYAVTIFDPEQKTPGTPSAIISGPVSTGTLAGTTLSFSPLDFGDGYQIREVETETTNWTDGAENGSDRFEATTSGGYDIIQSNRSSSGDSAYILSTTDFESQDLRLKEILLISEDSRLEFQSSQSAMFDAEPMVQVSVNGGTSWNTAWNEANNRDKSNSSFDSVSVDLSAYAGQTAHIRFHLSYSPGSSLNTSADPQWGWAIDEITPVNVEKVVSISDPKDILGPDFIYRSDLSGERLIQVRQRAFEHYFLDWSHAYSIDADNAFNHSLILNQNQPFENLGTVFGSTNSWGWSDYLGFIESSHFPSIYQANHGWFQVAGGTPESGLWMTHQSYGWVYTQSNWEGQFVHEPFGQDDWKDF